MTGWPVYTELTEKEAEILLKVLKKPERDEVSSTSWDKPRPGFFMDVDEGEPNIAGCYLLSADDDLVEIHLQWENIPGMDDTLMFSGGYWFNAYRHEVRNWEQCVTAVRNHLKEIITGGWEEV